ncbi:MAG: 3-hydroxy-5-phosphonooxypentane-2,4-dione thiolase [Nitrosopumilaceae archaeon]
MDWGLKNRLARIIKPADNRAVMLAVDHGYFLGPTERLENPKQTVRPLLKYCDSIMLTRGVLRTSVDPNYQVPVVLRVSGGPSIIGEDLSNEEITVSLQDALKVNASALAMSIFVGAKHEKQTIVNLGNLVNEAEQYGLPVLAVTAVGKDMVRDARYLSLACRMAAEQGAHFVKTYYCEDFEKVVESCPIPVIIAGGKKITEKEALELTYNAVQAGAVGVDMGRNIWQSDNPVPMIKAVRAIVHGHANASQAYDLFKELSKEVSAPKTQTPAEQTITEEPKKQKKKK